MSKYILTLMSVIVLGVSACNTDDNAKQKNIQFKPGPKVQLPPKDEVKVGPETTPPNDSQPSSPETVAESNGESSEKSDDAVPFAPVVFIDQNHGESFFGNATVVAALPWSNENTINRYRLLSEDEFYNIGKFDPIGKMILECTFHGRKTIVKHILALPEFLNDKSFNEGNISWQQEIESEQDIGKWDYSFSGIYKYIVGQKAKKTELIEVTCVEVK